MGIVGVVGFRLYHCLKCGFGIHGHDLEVGAGIACKGDREGVHGIGSSWGFVSVRFAAGLRRGHQIPASAHPRPIAVHSAK